MNDSNKPLKPPSISPKVISIIFALTALIGFTDALYLAIKHIQGIAPTCSFLAGCGAVTASPYSEILGIPVALLGTLYYLSMLVGSLIYLDTKKDRILHLLSYFTITGFAFSVYFTFLQAFIIKSFCQYCLLSAFTSTLLFIIGMIFLAQKRKV